MNDLSQPTYILVLKPLPEVNDKSRGRNSYTELVTHWFTA